jgi:serine/threonine-protein kinase
MFEMLAGRPPFIGPTAVSIAMQHASTYPPSLRQFNSNVPPALEQIVVTALAKEPVDRFLSAAEMQQALRQCAKDLRQQARPHETVPSPPVASTNYPLGAGGQRQFHPPGYGQRLS